MPVQRTDEEAWALVLANQRLVNWALSRFMARIPGGGWKRGDFETGAQLAAFHACKTYDESQGSIGTFLPYVIHRRLLDEIRGLQVGARTTSRQGAVTYATPTATGSFHETPSRDRLLPTNATAKAVVRESARTEFADQVTDRVYLETALDTLAARFPKDATLLRRHYFEGTPFTEIAVELGITKDTVDSRANKARRRLREVLEGVAA